MRREMSGLVRVSLPCIPANPCYRCRRLRFQIHNDFSASVNVVRLRDADIVHYIVTETENMDPENLAKQLERYDIKVVITVRLYGLPADISKICRLAEVHGAAVIEDCAVHLARQYLGSRSVRSVTQAATVSTQRRI